jgi:hypothetical protein
LSWSIGLQLFLYFLGGLIGLYLLLSLIFTYAVQQLPRKPVTDPPDWGRIIDTKIPAIDGGLLEVWRIEPQSPDFCPLGLYNGFAQRAGPRGLQPAPLYECG